MYAGIYGSSAAEEKGPEHLHSIILPNTHVAQYLGIDDEKVVLHDL